MILAVCDQARMGMLILAGLYRSVLLSRSNQGIWEVLQRFYDTQLSVQNIQLRPGCNIHKHSCKMHGLKIAIMQKLE